jgi:hypothetical protein
LLQGLKDKKKRVSVVDWHRFDGDPDLNLTFHFDADPDPNLEPSPSLHMLENQNFLWTFNHRSASKHHKFQYFGYLVERDTDPNAAPGSGSADPGCQSVSKSAKIMPI